MNDDRRLPPDFDWVTARAQCSAETIFDELRRLALANVERANALRGGTDPKEPRFRFKDMERSYANGFVITDSFASVRRAVSVRASGDTIHVEPTQGLEFTAVLTLTDAGDCMLRVGNAVLDEWQFLRRALEGLFFDGDGVRREG